jgi:hypothetical protein
MKLLRRIAIGILATASLGLASFSAHAHPGAAGGMGPGMSGPKQQEGQAAGAHHGRMAQHQGRHGAGQRHAAAGPAEGCPMQAQRSAETTHNH